jgi:hypothetical protein
MNPAPHPIDEALSRARNRHGTGEEFQLLARGDRRIHRAIEQNMCAKYQSSTDQAGNEPS